MNGVKWMNFRLSPQSVDLARNARNLLWSYFDETCSWERKFTLCLHVLLSALHGRCRWIQPFYFVHLREDYVQLHIEWETGKSFYQPGVLFQDCFIEGLQHDVREYWLDTPALKEARLAVQHLKQFLEGDTLHVGYLVEALLSALEHYDAVTHAGDTKIVNMTTAFQIVETADRWTEIDGGGQRRKGGLR